MTVTTERDRIRTVAERWLNQYPVDGERTLRSHRTILAKLQAMDPETATSAEVEAVIGNGSWTTDRCNECKEWTHGWAIMVGDEPDYDSRTATLCLSCARKVAALLPKDAPL